MHCIHQILTVLQAELTRCGDALARCQGERDALQGQISNDAQVVGDKQALEDAVKKQVGLPRRYTVCFRSQRPLCDHVSCGSWCHQDPSGLATQSHEVHGTQQAGRFELQRPAWSCLIAKQAPAPRSVQGMHAPLPPDQCGDSSR